VARPREGTADLASAGHWCRSGRESAQVQALRAGGRIRRKTAVVRLVAISATATIGNGGSGCCGSAGVRGACRIVVQMVHERRRRRGGGCGSAGDGGRGREVRKAVYVMEERMYRRCTRQWCRTSQLRWMQARAENADGANPGEDRRRARGVNEGNPHVEGQQRLPRGVSGVRGGLV
jgi:hypothetical protein